MSLLRKGALVLTYIAVSAALIRYNKFLMQADRFPHAMALTACHSTASLVLSSVLYLVYPSVFTGMASVKDRGTEVIKWFLPIGFLFATALYCSNAAYKYSNVTFLQFMKEANVMITFLISCCAGLQIMNRVRLANIVWIIVGSSVAVSGEIDIVFVGFLYQAISQVAECSRAVMGECVLRGRDFQLDVFTYTMLSAPFCLLALVTGTAFTADGDLAQSFGQWWPYILPNACLAFVLQTVCAAVIKEISAVGFILAGIAKDIVIVLISAVFFGERVTGKQYVSFTLTLVGIFFWSYMIKNPDSLLVAEIYRVTGCPQLHKDGESVPLSNKKDPMNKAEA